MPMAGENVGVIWVGGPASERRPNWAGSCLSKDKSENPQRHGRKAVRARKFCCSPEFVTSVITPLHRSSRAHRPVANARAAERAARILVLVIATALSGCAAVMGDFGRAEPSPFQSEVIPAKGAVVDADGKAKVAAILLTDAERDMRARIWRFLTAPHSYDWFADTAAQLQAAGTAKASGKPARTDRYYTWLHKGEYGSAAVRYNRLSADIDDDLQTLPAAFASICSVEQLDRQRGLAANQLDLEAPINAGAAARQHENRDLADRFARALRNRYDSYQFALDHLLVEAPDAAARGIDAQLGSLAIPLEAAERGDYCATSSAVTVAAPIVLDAPTGGPRSRFAPVG